MVMPKKFMTILNQSMESIKPGRPEKPDYADSEWSKKMVLLDKKIDRPGAGRPAKPKEEHRQTITIRLSPETMALLKETPRNMRGRLIEEAIRARLEAG